MSDDRKTDGSPESTWGATAKAKEAWVRKYGSGARKARPVPSVQPASAEATGGDQAANQ